MHALTKLPCFAPGALFRSCLLPALTFVGLMLSFYALYDPYLVVGEELIPDGAFSSSPLVEPTPWKVHNRRLEWGPDLGFNGGGGLRLDTRNEKGGRIDFVIDDPIRFEALRARGRMRSEKIVEGTVPWRVARMLLFFTDAERKAHWELPHVLCVLKGTKPWRHFEATFPVPTFAHRAFFVVQNPSKSGVVWADDLSLIPVRRKEGARLWTAAFALAWGALLAYVIVHLRLWSQRWGKTLVLIVLLIVAGVASPARTVSAALDGPVEVFASVQELAKPLERARSNKTDAATAKTPQEAAGRTSANPPRKVNNRKAPTKKKLTSRQLAQRNEIATHLKKAGHALLFALLALFGVLALFPAASSGIERLTLLAGGLLLFAVATECLQILVKNREPSVRDVIIDASGLLAGLLIGLLLVHLHKWRTRGTSSSTRRGAEAVSRTRS